MRDVILYIAMSLDGYIADINENVDFLCGDNSDSNNAGSYEDFIQTIDTIILGYNTYNQIVTELSPNNWPYLGKKTYVITSKNIESKDDIVFINEDLKTFVNKLKNESGKNIWICGGANIINQLLNEIDKFFVTVIPTILGDGIPLFKKHENELKLKLTSTNQYNGIIDLVYEKR